MTCRLTADWPRYAVCGVLVGLLITEGLWLPPLEALWTR